MKRLKQKDVAKWLKVLEPTLANYFCDNRKPRAQEAKRLADISGISFEEWMLSDGETLRQKVFLSCREKGIFQCKI